MKIDFGSFAFGYKIQVGGGTPNWATSLGQGKEYKINDDPNIDEILKGIIYSSVPLSKISTKIGKGGKTIVGNTSDSPIINGAVFNKVYVNDQLIENGKYILLVTRDDSESHSGRLRIKYGPHNTYVDSEATYSNSMFWDIAKNQLGMEDEACFFIYDISVKNQNELVLNTIIVDSQKTCEYENSQKLHTHWEKLIEENTPLCDKILKNCLDVRREERKIKIHPLNSIVYGAPGTGKTYSMAEYAQAIIGNISREEFCEKNKDRKKVMDDYHELIRKGQIVFTTFHQSYGYEEFIQGLRPDSESETMRFKIVDGIFKRIADKALNDSENNYVIIIDEINRANISKVFGELITLIEDDKRWGEINQTNATLQSGDIFAVPNNLYIIGTMNSADKSISLIDTALRRRFEFIEQKPEPDKVNDPTMKAILVELNKILVDKLDSADLLIGHSYFMNKTIDDLPKVLNNSIIPLLYEYFYDEKNKVKQTLKDSMNNDKVNVKDYVICDDKLGRLYVIEGHDK